jgi:hypothetical protein
VQSVRPHKSHEKAHLAVITLFRVKRTLRQCLERFSPSAVREQILVMKFNPMSKEARRES